MYGRPQQRVAAYQGLRAPEKRICSRSCGDLFKSALSPVPLHTSPPLEFADSSSFPSHSGAEECSRPPHGCPSLAWKPRLPHRSANVALHHGLPQRLHGCALPALAVPSPPVDGALGHQGGTTTPGSRASDLQRRASPRKLCSPGGRVPGLPRSSSALCRELTSAMMPETCRLRPQLSGNPFNLTHVVCKRVQGAEAAQPTQAVLPPFESPQ